MKKRFEIFLELKDFGLVFQIVAMTLLAYIPDYKLVALKLGKLALKFDTIMNGNLGDKIRQMNFFLKH